MVMSVSRIKKGAAILAALAVLWGCGAGNVFPVRAGLAEETDEQRIFTQILSEKAEAQRNDDEHDAPMIPPDVWVDPHGKSQTQQEEQQREEHGKRG